VQSFGLQLLLNESRFGLRWDTVDRLTKALKRLHPEDSYSRNAVKLELANQLILRGQVSQAYDILDKSFQSIYASRNRQQIAQVNLRLAYLTWLRGRPEDALHLLNAGSLQLRTDDFALWRMVRGLERKIRGESPTEPGTTGVDERIVRREQAAWKQAVATGEDRVGDLYDQIARRDRAGLELALKHGLYFFIYHYIGRTPGEQGLLFDVMPRGLLILNRGDCRVVEHGFSRTLRRLLECVSQTHCSKSELVRRVWGYEYDPSRHDALVYTSVSKVRKLLGDVGYWLEGDESGYRLRSGIRLHSTQVVAPRPEVADGFAHMRLNSEVPLNYRQLKILSRFDTQQDESVSADAVMGDFKISRATATRDLAELTEHGYLRRLGKARASRYVRTPKLLTR
jgi:hypothetical protein